MPLKERPKHAPGTFPGQDFVGSEGIDGVRIGYITRVDELHMKADVHIITGGGTDRFELDLTQAMAGPRSFWGGVPEINSHVILGYRKKHKKISEAMILGYLPQGNLAGLKFDPMALDDPSNITSAESELYQQTFTPTTRVKRLKLRPGDVGGMSAGGSELVLNNSIQMLNRAGDMIELRDSERLLISQAINQFHSGSGVKTQFGPTRRTVFYLPPDIFQGDDPTKPLLEAPMGDNPANPTPISQLSATVPQHYFGQSVLQALGPGNPGDPTKYTNAAGVVNSFFNNTAEYPPVVYSNGKRAFFAADIPFANFESANTPANVYTEHRIELKHQTDAVQDVLDEIDGFNVDTLHPRPYIEHVMGTVVGNDPSSDDGMELYGQILKPTLFDNWQSKSPGRFKMLATNRTVGQNDLEPANQAGAFLFRVNPPQSPSEDDPFALCISKQGKVYVNIPGSNVEDTYDGTKNVSLEAMLGGGLKAYVGKEALSGESIHLFCEGAIHFEVNGDASGNGVTPIFNCAYNVQFNGGNNNPATPGTAGQAYSEQIRGNCQRAISGDDVKTINGSCHTIVDGQHATQATRVLVNATSGNTLNASEDNKMISGKSQYNYGLAVLENIAAGGKISTILAGGLIQNVVTGAQVTNVAGGAMSDNVGAAYSLAAGGAAAFTAGGAATMTAGGAVSVTGGAAVSITAGIAATVTSPVAVSLTSPQCLLGGPPAVLGISRGLPIMPPLTPSLDWITGLALMGCAVNRSI
jgi:hypothetical protein